MFEFIFSLAKKMTFVSIRMVQKSGKSHFCSIKYRKLCDGRATLNGVFESTPVCQQVYRDRLSNSSFLWSKNDFCIKRDGSKSRKSHFCNIKYWRLCDGEQYVPVFFKVLWYANKCIAADVRIHLFFGQKMTFVSKGMVQKSGKPHFCSIKYRKLCDGEQHVLVFFKVLWNANKRIAPDVRIHLFFGKKMTFVSIRMVQKSGKSQFCSIKYRKFCEEEQHVMVFFKVHWYANKCIAPDVRIHLFFGQENDVCIKSDCSKTGRIVHLQYKM